MLLNLIRFAFKSWFWHLNNESELRIANLLFSKEPRDRTRWKYLVLSLYQLPHSTICQSAIGGVWLYIIIWVMSSNLFIYWNSDWQILTVWYKLMHYWCFVSSFFSFKKHLNKIYQPGVHLRQMPWNFWRKFEQLFITPNKKRRSRLYIKPNEFK